MLAPINLKIKTREEADIVRTMLLKSTKRARYSTTNLGEIQVEDYLISAFGNAELIENFKNKVNLLLWLEMV